ncbi:MAG: outer membrane beta-barrel protein [Rhodocyclaceae bacterium]
MSGLKLLQRSVLFTLLSAAWSAHAQTQAATKAAADPSLDDGDAFHVYVGQGLKYESNVYKLSDGINPVGESHQDDWVSLTSAGLDFNKQFGRQRVYALLGGTIARYASFDQLNYESENIRAGWTTGFGSDSTASIKYQNYRAPVDMADRLDRRLNIVTDNRIIGDAAVRVGGPWMVVGGAIVARSRNSLDDATGGDNDSFAGEAGLRYAPRTDNWLDLRYRQSKYDYPNVILPDPSLGLSPTADNSFKQREWRLSALYEPTGISTFDGYVAWLQRDHNHLSERDFSGWTGQLNYTWNVTTITALKFQVYRDLGAINDGSATYARTMGLAFRPSWQATPKLGFGAVVDWRKRDYQGNQVAGLDVEQRRENVWTLGVNADWQVTPRWLVQASLSSAHRNSTLSTDNYDDVVAYANIRYRF